MTDRKSDKKTKNAPVKRRPIALSWASSAQDDSLRETGIDLLGRVPWGTHISLFYETAQDLLDAAVHYFEPARRYNEYCIWVVGDPLSNEDAERALGSMPGLKRRRKADSFKIIRGLDLYSADGRFQWPRIVDEWHRLADAALANGFDGLRAFGNPLWRWRDVAEYEHALEMSLASRRVILICAYSIKNTTPQDILDVARNHQCLITRRNGEWEYLEVPGTEHAKRELKNFNEHIDALPRTVQDVLTERERIVIAQVAKGASNKEIARTLGISPRTVEFHRGNIMRKIGAKNATDLVLKVFGHRRGNP